MRSLFRLADPTQVSRPPYQVHISFCPKRTEDELDRQVTLDQAGLEDRHREVVLEVHPAFRTPGVTAPLREQDGAGLAARCFRIAVRVEMLKQLVRLRLWAVVVLRGISGVPSIFRPMIYSGPDTL